MYPSAFLVVDGDSQYSKHYFAGSERIVSRIGDQSPEIFDFQDGLEAKAFDPVALKQLQINDLQAISEKAKMGKVTFKVPKAESSKAEEEERLVPQAGNIYFFHPDHLGTATYLTDINGNPYQFFLNLPFGETMAEQHSLSEDYSNPYKFNGKELDEETGLYYYGARYYDPRTSIWLGVDPLAESFPNANPYNYCLQNPINLVDPDGRAAIDNDDIIFTGMDNKQIRVVAPGKDIHVPLPFNVGKSRTVDLGASKIDGGRFVYGYTVQADVNIGVGIVAQYGGEVSVANFTDGTYGGYNYVYAGGHEAGSTGIQASASASAGASIFVGYNDDNKEIRPSSFAGETYSSTISADVKAIGGAGVSLSRFSSVKDPDSQKGWKGISIGINVGVGDSANLGSVGQQVSTTALLNTPVPTSQRSTIDKVSNSIAPITSTLLKMATGN